MKVERFKISTLYRGMALEGVCRVIYPSTFMITMEKPYKGLSKTEHFFDTDKGTFTMETIKSRAVWELGRLYEQYQDIRYNYVRYKKMMEEWEQCGCISRRFDEMIKRYGIMPLSLSPSVLKISIKLIEESGNEKL